MIDFNNRPVLVTGATGRIGAVTVRQLAAAGADVIASGRSIESVNELADRTGARTLPFDLISEDSVRDAVGIDLYGVVNCGGFGGEIATPMDTDLAIFDKVIAINTDIAGPIVFLLSDAASMITGVTLPIDGGYSSR